MRQHQVFPSGVTFDTPEEQEVWVRNWLNDAGLAKESERLRLVSWRAVFLIQWVTPVRTRAEDIARFFV